MQEKMFKVKFIHLLYDTVLELALPASITFGEILAMLYKKGFIEKKAADYGFIINEKLCALNKPLKSYIPLYTVETVEIQINGMLTIMC